MYIYSFYSFVSLKNKSDMFVYLKKNIYIYFTNFHSYLLIGIGNSLQSVLSICWKMLNDDQGSAVYTH